MNKINEASSKLIADTDKVTTALKFWLINCQVEIIVLANQWISLKIKLTNYLTTFQIQ